MSTHSSILAWRIPWTEEPGDYSPWGHKVSDTTEQLTHCRREEISRNMWLDLNLTGKPDILKLCFSH